MELINWIQLINTDNIGPITFYKLIEQFGSAKEAVQNLPPKYNLFPKSKAEREIELAASKGIKIITYNDEAYPENLKQIDDAPPVLYILGNVEVLKHNLSLSIVGARNASINGRKTASKIAYELTNNDVLIVSGMARGIDSAAHKGAMYALNQQGPTLAVLGTGVDVIYPSENKDLYAQIATQGAIISEFPLGTEPQSNNFPRRNRIVSAISQGTLVVEATINSGSLITSRLALEQGKDIFAVPGSPQDTRAAGPNKLIKEGAVLVEEARDILDVLIEGTQKHIRPLPKHSIDKTTKFVAIQEKEKTPKTSNIEQYLSNSAIEIDELIRVSGLDAATVSLMLLELELDGKIERQVGNKVALIGKIKK